MVLDLSGKNKIKRKEDGEIMLEGMIVIIITLFILIWILAVGFIYYQRYIKIVWKEIKIMDKRKVMTGHYQENMFGDLMDREDYFHKLPNLSRRQVELPK